MPSKSSSLASLIHRFGEGDRGALAKAITLVESEAPEAALEQETFLAALTPRSDVLRFAISGPPGVGKSTFINALGQRLINLGFKLAVLPIDPSSETRLGSILADKTRMKDLVHRTDAFIRPSPSRGALGGVAHATRDVMLVVEGFGFSSVIIETVGVGQSETLARLLCDHFIVLLQPGAGDQLQAMKKGIIEVSDMLLVNKADGELLNLAEETAQMLAAQGTFVLAVSAQDGRGLDQCLEELLKRHEALIKSGSIAQKRREKLDVFSRHAFSSMVVQSLLTKPDVLNELRRLTKDLHPDASITQVLRRYLRNLGW